MSLSFDSSARNVVINYLKIGECKLIEIQHRSKCKKEFTEYPALSRVDNETEICPECGAREAVEVYQKATQ